jgi:hypothetical protein
MIARAPMISKIGPRALKNDTGSTFSKAKPASIDAKNKKINSFIFHPSFIVIYVFVRGSDWTGNRNITILLQKKQASWPVLSEML